LQNIPAVALIDNIRSSAFLKATCEGVMWIEDQRVGFSFCVKAIWLVSWGRLAIDLNHIKTIFITQLKYPKYDCYMMNHF